jgi:hypothetical protein
MSIQASAWTCTVIFNGLPMFVERFHFWDKNQARFKRVFYRTSYPATSFMMATITCSTSSATGPSSSAPNMASMAVGLMVTNFTFPPSA